MKNSRPLKADLLHLAVLMSIAAAIGVYLIATCVIIQRDGVFYIDQARRLADDPLGVARRYPVGYPILLFLAHKAMGLGDSAQAWVISSQSVTLLTRVLALIPLYLAGKRLVGPRRSFLALLILLVLPNLAGYGSSVLREWPFILFLSLGFWLLIVALDGKRWWMFGLVGLSTGLGYQIRPMCGQIILYGLAGLAVTYRSKELGGRRLGPIGASLLMLVGLAVPVVPCWVWTGRVIPPQLKPSPGNGVPAIVSVGTQSASREPLLFQVSVGRELELTIEADDRDGDVLTFSVVGIPLGTRPVHCLRSKANGACFWTISEARKDALLETYGADVWAYEGIAYYAYPTADVVAGLKPVYRFWSPVVNRHFYSLDGVSQKSLPGDPNLWQPEGVAFYAFPEGAEPAGAIPVYRFTDETGHGSWTAQALAESQGVAWYAQPAIALPEGASLQGRTFRWSPGPTQQGVHQLNIIVSDGELLSCQLVRINVNAASSNRGRSNDPQQVSPIAQAGLLRLPAVAIEIVGTLGHSLRVFFLLPLCLGLCHRFKHPMHRYERALMIAIVAVNLGLISARSLWIHPEVARRYCMALIALTIWYIPIGLELMANWLRTSLGQTSRWPWLGILTAAGVALCLPRLMTPIGDDGRGYRQVARWLQANTARDQVIAVPDGRISFYAERQDLRYDRHPDPRRADYVVVVRTDKTGGVVRDRWHEKYAAPIGRKRNKELVVYEIR